MLEEFRKYIHDHSLCKDGDRVLVAVSGGIDSVVLLNLFNLSGYNTGVAHCNFLLRGEESEGDARFVEDLAASGSLPFHIKDFKTGEFATERGISLQMAARELRYGWFEQVRTENGYDIIATAHNQDDLMETFFINLSRSTGIRGLTGISTRTGSVIRPLLFASRGDITRYAEEKGICFREDSSNASGKYLRNRIRHQLLPFLEEQNPSFRNSLLETMRKLSETERLFSVEMEKIREDLLIREGDRILIRIPELQNLESARTILFELLSEFDFNSASIDDILESIKGPPGKRFFSPTHRLVKDREELILTPLRDEPERRYYLELSGGQIYDPLDLEWILVKRTENFKIPTDPFTACLDMDLLEFPLILRRWQKGDYFQPLGMEGLKKLSDFLIDQKVSIPDKENTWLLTSGETIAWVIGHRIDNRFKITEKTTQILMIKYKI